MNKKNNYIWIFGENLGDTANNNSFYFWKHIINKPKENINKYIVLTKNKNNMNMYNNLNKKEKRAVIWRNSLKHFILYKSADMLFVTLSYRDVLPEKCLMKKIKMINTKPIIYLQHGTLGIKKINYTGCSYNNNMFRFVYYNKDIKNVLKKENDFRGYQLYYGEFQPRWKELVRRYNKRKEQYDKIHQITWFLTWREYLGNNIQTKLLIRKIRSILNNEKFQKYLSENNIKLNLVLHQFFQERKDEIFKDINNKNIVLLNQKEIDLMQIIVDTDLLITDYSSIGFDVTLLNKPVIMFFPDIDEYLKGREIYCSIEELKENGITSTNELVNRIISEDYKVNEFFKSRLSKNIDFNYIEEGKHIDRMYKYLKKLQKNKITFIGYNFYGVGGTVSATRSLAEGLLEKGNMVSLLSLKKTVEPSKMPYGLNLEYLYDSNSKKIKDKIKRNKLIWGNKNLKYLNNDPSKEYIAPYAGFALKRRLDKIRSNTVISTRESIHQFLIDGKSNMMKNKIYFYHCPSNVMEELFPGVINELKQYQIDKAVFVTEKNRKAIEEQYGYNHYNKFLISGNAIERKNCRNINKIESVEQKDVYRGIYLLRISEERVPDLNNLISFGEYLKLNNIKNIVIDVFGDGDYVEQFLDILEEKDLMDVICYKGKTNNPTHHIRHHDVLVDFSVNHSFGMTYIEGILNGKMVYCMKNPGSLEVIKDIPEAFIESNEDLVNKINNIPNITKERLQENYRNIETRFSRKIVADRFLGFLKAETNE